MCFALPPLPALFSPQVERLSDPISPVSEILKRVPAKQLMVLYKISVSGREGERGHVRCVCVYVCVCVKEHKENVAQRQCMRCSKATVCVCVCVCVFWGGGL